MPLSLQKSLCRVDLPGAVCCQLSMLNVFSYFLYFSEVTTVKLGDQWPYNSLEKNLSTIGNFVCSWCCFFSISKYLETFKRFVEKRNTFADMLMKIFFEIFLVQPIPLIQMPAYAFSDSVSYLVIFSHFLAREIAPHNLTWANQHVKHHVNWHHASSSF